MSTIPNFDNDVRVAKVVKNGNTYALESYPLLGWSLAYCTAAPAAITPWGPVELAQTPEYPSWVLFNGESVLQADGWLNARVFLEQINE